MAAFATHAQLQVQITPDEIVLEPGDSSSNVVRQTLTFDRGDGTLRISRSSTKITSSKTAASVLGLVTLHGGAHLILVSEATKVGLIPTVAAMGVFANVHKVVSVEVIPVLSKSKLTAQEELDNNKYLAMLREFILASNFYFSYTHDITRAAQFQDASKLAEPLYKKADKRFFWNEFLLRDLIKQVSSEPDLSHFIVPVIKGFVEIKEVAVKATAFTYAILTRHNRNRAGTRYHTRGVDVEGNVANFNETEQLVWFKNNALASFVQIRGSIPMYWRQIINLKYKPQLEIDDQTKSVQAAATHFSELTKIYGSKEVVVVNLIDTKGYELKVGLAFKQVMQALGNQQKYKYVHFDFHTQCKKMRYDNLQKLMDEIKGSLDQLTPFQIDAYGNAVARQSSVIRTNCMDCLDRTNVVQALFARHFLRQQLVQQGIIEENDRIENHRELETMLRNIWADNADAVSTAYSGTGALKTDFTRTGKRTQQGAIQDGANSVIRYIKNNFYDGWKQDSIDLFLGNFRVSPTEPSPFLNVENPDAAVRARVLPLVWGLSVVMLIASVAAPTGTAALRWIYIAFWALSFVFTTRSITGHGADFVNRPKLFGPISGKLAPQPPLL